MPCPGTLACSLPASPGERLSFGQVANGEVMVLPSLVSAPAALISGLKSVPKGSWRWGLPSVDPHDTFLSYLSQPGSLSLMLGCHNQVCISFR